VDCKGQVVTILAALHALREARVTLNNDLIVQFVVEEEVGGNGALAAILDGPRADGVVVLEAT
jgi:acetylornithine deacetylase